MKALVTNAARVLFACALVASGSPVLHAQQVSDRPLPPPGPRPDAATIQHWEDRRFGMFIHFGLFSVPGGVWDGKRVTYGYSEQIQSHAPVPKAAYEALAKTFDPVKFDPDAIVALAKTAGMKFIVLTAKHHDGFAMFHTAQNRYNVIDATPYRRDVVKALADACARAKMPFGVYYSTIDWHWMGGQFRDNNDNPISPAQADFNAAQIGELMRGYGPISEIWFDMGKPTPAQSARFTRAVHDVQPQTMVSGRVWNHQGDFTVMGDNQEPDTAVEEPWQSPASIFPDTWGYRSWEKRDDLPGKIRENIARLVRVASAGGNYLLNIGPKGDGSVVPYEADVLRGIGAWLKPRGAAIYGTRAAPFPKLDFGYATLGDHTLYLFMEKRPADGVLRLPGVVDTHFGTPRVLADDRTATVSVRTDANGATVQIPALAGTMPVIALPIEGDLHVRPSSIVPIAANGSVHLDAAHAQHFVNTNGYGYEDPPTLYKLRWHAALGAGAYSIDVRYRAAVAGAAIDLWVDGQRQRLVLSNKATHATARVQRDPRAHPYAMAVEITPPAPFQKGDRLPATVDAVTLRPAAESPRSATP